jgi:aldose 1-epimerase
MPVPPSGRQVRLAAHDQEIVVVEVGGGLRLYRAGDRDILDGYGEDEVSSGGRGQLLAPWPNRLADGSYQWNGTRRQADITEVAAHNAIHGLVRWANWVVPDSTPQPWTPATPPDTTQVTYRLHPQPGWPWTLDFRVSYRLAAETGLEVRTAVTNASDEECPVGFGWHPYLKAHVDQSRLTVPAATVYEADERGIPRGRRPVDGTEADFRRPRTVGATKLDVALTDLQRDADGRVRVVLEPPGADPVTLWVDGQYTHLMVFTGDTLGEASRRRQGLAVEPMTCAPDMLNNHDGLRTLAPGATMEAAWGVDPFRSP